MITNPFSFSRHNEVEFLSYLATDISLKGHLDMTSTPGMGIGGVGGKALGGCRGNA